MRDLGLNEEQSAAPYPQTKIDSLWYTGSKTPTCLSVCVCVNLGQSEKERGYNKDQL